MTSAWIAALFACFVWWISTGLLLLVVRRADRAGGLAHLRAALAGLPLAGLALAGVLLTRGDGSVTGAYLGFLAALALWGAVELSFLTGAVTGPNRKAWSGDGRGRGRERLKAAWEAVIWHELLLAAGLLVVVVLTADAPNAIALYTYLVLFLARILAKVNLFLGVPRINIEFVPRPLAHLTSFFRQGPVTPAFPVAITFLSCTTVCFLFLITGAATQAETVAFALLAALSGLALLEHWLMVLPLPDAALWRWMLPKPAPQTGALRPPLTHTER